MSDTAGEVRREELLIDLLAGLIGEARHVAVGAASPIPAAAALLCRETRGTRVTLLHSRRYNPFTEGSRELFDAAGQGRIDVFFLGGVQIDGGGNVNLVATGAYPDIERRFPGSFGSAFMAFAVPRVILFREEHSPRVLVDKVDFVSAPGHSEPGIWRRGGPTHLVTDKAVFAFDRDKARFRLASIHPWSSLDEIRELTGFSFDHDTAPVTTPLPDEATLAVIRGPVAAALAESYPGFAARVFGAEAAAAG